MSKPRPPAIGIVRSRFVELDDAGEEIGETFGLVLRKDYGPGSIWNEDLHVTGLTREQVMDPNPANLARLVHAHGEAAADTIRFGRENAPGITVGTRFLSWDALGDHEGYDAPSP